MIKYYCDICENEVRIASRRKVPLDLDVDKTIAFATNLCLTTVTKTLCVNCYEKLQDAYKNMLDTSINKGKVI